MTRLADEVDALRLKLDANRLERCRDIVRKLSTEPGIDPIGHTILQLPWQRSDADLCDGFVSEAALRWQEESFAPLYTLTLPTQYIFTESIGGINVREEEAAGMFYAEEGHQIQVSYVSRPLRDELLTLERGKVYRRISERRDDGALAHRITHQVRVRSIVSELATHDPERWRIIVDWANEPLTWHAKEYRNGRVVKQTPSLADCTLQELTDLYPIDEAMAARILDARTRYGVLTRDVLRQVEGISATQLQWIESFTRS